MYNLKPYFLTFKRYKTSFLIGWKNYSGIFNNRHTSP